LNKKIFVIALLVLVSCNKNNKKQEDLSLNEFTYSDVFEKDSVLYFQDGKKLFTGKIINSDSTGRVVKEISYVNGLKHGQEIHFEYFYSDLPVVIMEGTWKKGKKVGLWKSHDGEGRMTVIKNYDQRK
jgi:antitoxin component YwqK of YwqJK toxin-antitoxin module